ncbi:MAG TPA: FAD-dependent oxidoreductase [Solirubrobacteraceae bacterium]|nr:FAD-dependent oxidoreductase [Solirubrobacteraceae bacterium]
MAVTTSPTGRVPRFDVLLEPVRIGPVVARNRFFQVPHCNGMGYRDVSAHAGMRAVKGEGGWAVICTEQAEIHYSSEITPFIELRIWDDQDIPAIARIAERIHEYDALAGIELCYNGMNGPNLYSRVAPMGPSHLPVATFTADPVQARRMDLDDIADLRRWHRAAVRRSIQAGYDLVYVYSGHALGGIHHFLSRRYNDRTDAYGGSAENRMRLLREILEDTLQEADGRAAVACRITVDELLGDDGITREDIEEVVGTLGELPDLWDFVLGSWEDDSVTARFGEEGEQEQYVRGLKQLTSKPVVGVGRFTSPDTMVRMVRSGVLDLIGAARPSIADPFLPRKIEEGRLEDIRECIGCNICVSGDFTMSPIRCTQNPSMGEEWRRGWHPERIRPRTTDAKVLIVGGGPAGLEAAQSLGKRGYEVILAEASASLGGRVAREARLPGMASYIRVVDYRAAQLRRLRTVERTQGEVTAAEILTYDFDHVAVATGARWRDDGVGRHHTHAVPRDPSLPVLTPDDLMAGDRPDGDHVLIYDDDHYYMGGVLAELLSREGRRVTLVTPAHCVSSWTTATMEQHRIQRRLLELGVDIVAGHAVTATRGGAVATTCVFTAREREIACDAAVFVTARLPQDTVYQQLMTRRSEWADAGLRTVTAVGDCWCPATIAAAVWEGRRYAEELDEPTDRGDTVPFRREVTELAAE